MAAMIKELPQGGLDDLVNLKKELESVKVAGSEFSNSKTPIKLRFTPKQFATFRDACNILQTISEDPTFAEYVTKVLDADIKLDTITRQFVKPIVEAPMRITGLKAAKIASEKKETYFTKQIPATKNCSKLFSKVKDTLEDGKIRQNVNESFTCITDIRVMITQYEKTNNLKTPDGIIVDDFLLSIGRNAITENKSDLMRIDGKYVIPIGNRKVITDIVNEVAFGK